MRNLMCVMVALGLAGCASPDPATEMPVDLLPGLYQVTLGGGTVVELKAGGRQADVCFATDNALAFPGDPVSHLIPDWPGCTTTADDPKGNAISGLRNCPGGEGHQRKTTMRMSYAGSHGTDEFRIDGEVTQGDDEGGGVMRLGSGPFRISGKRIGECP